MGNNQAYSTFQHTIIVLYDRGKLDIDLLDTLAEQYRGTDIDSGGDTSLLAKDGKDLESICIAIIDPTWTPTKCEDYANSADSEEDLLYEKWHSITDERWGWQ